jgi:uncharacterized protein
MWVKTFHSYQEAGLSFGLNTVISQYNADLFGMQDFFAEKLHPKLNFGFEGVVIAHSPNAIEFTRFPKDAAIKLRESILRGVVLEPESNVGSALYKRSRGLLARIVNEVPALSIVGRCDACDPNSLGIDMFGNVLSCHNVDAKRESIGHIERFDEIRGNKFTHWSLRGYCHDCYVLNGCQGNCLRLDGFLHKSGCDVEKMFHGFIFEAVWVLLTGSEIQSISPVTD